MIEPPVLQCYDPFAFRHRSYPLQTDAAGILPADDFGPFRVLHQVGAGALGPVFRAYDPERDRLVALKLIRLDMPPDRAHALVAELSSVIGAGLTHPVIAAPIAAGLADVTPYLVQEFVSADSMDLVVRDNGAMRPDEAARVTTQLAAAIDFAAGVNVCHGALHPRDVLMSPDDVRLTGLGLAQALEQAGLTAPLRRPYTAPERAAGEAWSRPADVFSLAAVIYELLTGRRIAAVGDQAASGLGDRSPAMRRVFARALAERPGDRFPSATAFAEALQEVVHKGEEPVKKSVSAAADPGPREAKTNADGLEPEEATVASRESLRQRRGRATVARTEDALPRLPLDPELGPPAAPIPLGAAADTMVLESSAPAVLDIELAPMAVQPADTRILDLAMSDRTIGDGESPIADLQLTDDEVADRQMLDDPIAHREIVDSEFPVSEADDQIANRRMPDDPIADRRIADTVIAHHEIADSALEDGPIARHQIADAVVADSAGVHRRVADSAIADGADRQILEHPMFGTDEPAPSRGLLPMVLTLGLGIALGFAGGYALGTTRDVTPRTAATASTILPSGASSSAPSSAPVSTPSSPPTEFTESPIAAVTPDAVAPVAAPVDATPGAALGPVAPIHDAPLSSASASTSAPAAATPPSPAKAVPSNGRLLVRSSPSGARVFLDGKEIGQTPATARNVARGAHTVRVVGDGFVTAERRVTVTAANASPSLSVQLQRAPTAGRTSASASGTASSGTAGQYTGALFVESRPTAANVTVDGRVVGKTPLSLESFGAGEHAIQIELDGYRRWSGTVRVTAGERKKVAASLERP
jgi:serine/threonine protein kinase